MGSGLSMSSVNKIKELANSREYSLALEIIDSQDLSKSLNPQFLRVCGDVYMKNGRYADARKVLLMAHRMAPEAKRIMYSLVELYLTVGYFDLAKAYYDIYMHDADELNEETIQLKYIYNKSQNYDVDILEDCLSPRYVQNQDYDWSFELYLFYKIINKDEDAESLAVEYMARFKNSDYAVVVSDIQAGRTEAKDLFFIYSSVQKEDDEPEQESLRIEEQKLLESDELRIHPKEAEITIMVDDLEEEEIGSKRKLKKYLKEQEKLEKKKEKEAKKSNGENESEDKEPVENENPEGKAEDIVEDVVETASETDEEDSKKEKKSFFKKVFSKKSKDDDIVTEETEVDETDISQSVDEEVKEQNSTVEDLATEEQVEEEQTEDCDIDTNSVVKEDENNDVAVVETSAQETEITEKPDIKPDFELSDAVTEFFDNDEEDTVEDEGFTGEQHKIKSDSIVSYEFDDDGFEAEADTIDGLLGDKEDKSSIVFEYADISSEDNEDEFEVDDFSEAPDEEFGEMIQEETFEEEPVEETEEILEEEETVEKTEEIPEEEDAVEETEEILEGAELVEDDEEFEVDDFSDESDEDFGEMIQEETFEEEPAEEVEEILEKEETVEETEGILEETELVETDEAFEVDDFSNESDEEFGEMIQEETYEEESVEEAEEILEEEGTVEIPDEEDAVEETVSEIETVEQIYEFPKKKIDFPVFKSSLFPNYNKEITLVENNFDEIMTEAQGKIQENNQKEEQMLKEAEALLASLGIDLGSVATTTTSYEKINETLFEGPSRDDLKSSLKIDSVKKDILRKLKDYR